MLASDVIHAWCESIKGCLKGGDECLQHFRRQRVDSCGCCTPSSRGKGPAQRVSVLSRSQGGSDADAQGGVGIVNDQRMGSFLFFLGLQIGKNASYSSGPWGVGKVENPVFVAWIYNVLAERQGHVVLEALTQDSELRGGGDKIQRIFIGGNCPVKISRVKVEICQFCPIAVIIEELTQFLELFQVLPSKR